LAVGCALWVNGDKYQAAPNGVVTATLVEGGRPVAGNLRLDGTALWGPCDAGGTCRLGAAPSGQWNVLFYGGTAGGGTRMGLPDATVSATVTAGQTTNLGTIDVGRKGTIVGNLAGFPIGSVVAVAGENGVFQSIASDGTYTLTVPAGSYEVGVVASTGGALPQRVTVAADQTVTADFQYDAAGSGARGTIEGIATALGADHAPVAIELRDVGTTSVIASAASAPLVGSMTVDAASHFVFPNLAPSGYLVHASYAAYPPVDVFVVLLGGDDVHVAVVMVPPAACAAGSCTGGTGGSGASGGSGAGANGGSGAGASGAGGSGASGGAGTLGTGGSGGTIGIGGQGGLGGGSGGNAGTIGIGGQSGLGGGSGGNAGTIGAGGSGSGTVTCQAPGHAAATCDTTSSTPVCCISATGDASCVSTCTGAVSIACDGPEDCGSGGLSSRCCEAGPSTGCASMCGGMTHVVCHSSADCAGTSNSHCCAMPSTGISVCCM
jgi:hypothetical protein